MKYMCGCYRCKRCKVGIRLQSQVFIQRENGGWDGILMQDSDACLLHAITFVVEVEKISMEGAQVVKDYKEV